MSAVQLSGEHYTKADGESKLYGLRPDSQAIEALKRTAESAHGKVLDDTGGLIPLSVDELATRWRQLLASRR